MTVPSSSNRMEYTGNGVASSFDYTFQIFADTDLQVYVLDTDGVQTELVLTTDFTVSGAGDPDGGSIALTAGALTSGYGLVILREVPLTQEVDLRNQGAYYPETVETMGDRLMMGIQQLAERLGRSLIKAVTGGAYDLGGFRLTNVGNPVLPTDAAPFGVVAAAEADTIAARDAAIVAAGAAEDAQDAAEAAQAAAEAAASGVNLPSINPGDAGKRLEVNPGETGFQLVEAIPDQSVTSAKLADSVFLSAGTTISLSVVSSPATATEFATITDAINHVRRTYVPAGGVVEITVTKTTLVEADQVLMGAGEQLGHVSIIFPRGATYTRTGGSTPLIRCFGGEAPTLSVGTGTGDALIDSTQTGPVIDLRLGGKLRVTGTTGTNKLHLRTGNNDAVMWLYGGEVHVVGRVEMENTGTGAALLAEDGGVFRANTVMIFRTASVNVAAVDMFRQAKLLALSAAAISGWTNAVRAVWGCEVNTPGMSATSSGTNVSVTEGCYVNLSDSAATCNLTNNTVSTNGILIR